MRPPGSGMMGGMPGMGLDPVPGMRPGGMGGPPLPGEGGGAGEGMGMPGMGGGMGRALPSLTRSFPDGLPNTLLVVEAGRPVPWTKPDDVAYDPKKPVPALGGAFAGVFHAAFADGTVRALPRRIGEKTLRAIITPAGGESTGDLGLSRRTACARRSARR